MMTEQQPAGFEQSSTSGLGELETGLKQLAREETPWLALRVEGELAARRQARAWLAARAEAKQRWVRLEILRPAAQASALALLGALCGWEHCWRYSGPSTWKAPCSRPGRSSSAREPRWQCSAGQRSSTTSPASAALFPFRQDELLCCVHSRQPDFHPMATLINRVIAREIAQNLIDMCNTVDLTDRRAVDALREKAMASAKQIFGDDSVYIKVMREIKYHPDNVPNMANPTLEMSKSRAIGVGKLASILREMLMEIITGR
jgi:hypothetical protein